MHINISITINYNTWLKTEVLNDTNSLLTIIKSSAVDLSPQSLAFPFATLSNTLSSSNQLSCCGPQCPFTGL